MTTTTKTRLLTEGELSDKRGTLAERRAAGRFFSSTQEDCLEAAIRTGVRVGIQVNRGFYEVTECSYALDGKGRPKGCGSIRVVSDKMPCSQPELVNEFLRAYAG